MTAATPERSPVPVLSRQHAAGTESARGLLFTILGELVLPNERCAWTAGFLELFGRLGVEPKAGRQALMRTAAGGWLAAERIGRRTRWHLTPEAVALLTEGTERIYGLTGPRPGWDGRWVVVLARVPERDRAARHLLRTRLAWAGFGSVSPGVWVSPHAARRADAERILGEAGLLADALVFDGQFVAGQDLAAMAPQAWDLSAIGAAYAAFLAGFGDRGAADPLVALIELVHAWRRFPWADPALPAALLPAGWPGAAAAGLFTTRHAQWSRAAQAEWARIATRDG